jgi:hypothetical protein
MRTAFPSPDYYEDSAPPRAISRQRAFPPLPWQGSGRGPAGGSRVHLLSVDEGGTQLYPGGPRACATDIQHGQPGRAAGRPPPLAKEGRRAPQYRPPSARFRAGST